MAASGHSRRFRPRLYTLSLPLFFKTGRRFEALIVCHKNGRDHHRANHSLLAACLMATSLHLRNRTTKLATREFALFARVICQKIAPRAYWSDIPMPGFAGSVSDTGIAALS